MEVEGEESINLMTIHLRLSLVAFLLLLPALSRAQASSGDDVCLGFSFGAWNPPLDWRGAGHGDPPTEKSLQRAPDGRDWAVDLPAAGRDSTLLLFPSWWPAGVSVVVPQRALAVGDTVRAEAIALVADGRKTAPRSQVLVRRVTCRR